ncbi:MAG: DUF4233 domain-containing protein [Propioniciclava sp.]|uniref:DUF4233 domain-containing protein n=1 Tax=Propioniciclava sp. TaxID=2038686 RepID=UPI0039E5C063
MRLADGNPMTRSLALILIFEAIIFILAIAGMIQVADVPIGLALGAGLTAAVLALAAGGTLRRPFGWPLAWLTQVVAVLLGLLTPWMYAVGGMFALLYVVTFVLGKRIESRA